MIRKINLEGKIYKLGYLKDPHDPRDYSIRRFFCKVGLPRQCDYEEFLSPVRDQGTAGSCVGHGEAMVQDVQETRERGEPVITSPRFIYSECKKIDGIPDQEGTFLRFAKKVVKDLGVCHEDYCPYSSANAAVECPSQAFDQALEFKDISYARIVSLDEMRQSLYEHGPFIAGIPIYTSFLQSYFNGGKVPIPNIATEELYGGHAICIYAYNDDTRMFKFRNSWGKIYGNNGNGELPYDFFQAVGTSNYDAWQSVDAQLIPPDPDDPEPPEPDNPIGIRLQYNKGEGWKTLWEKIF